MRQNIKQNYIAYALLAGLFVYGLLFIATPIMAQEVSNETQIILNKIDSLNNQNTVGIVEIVSIVVGGLIIAGIGFLTKRVWGFPKFVADLDNIIKNFKNHKHTQKDGLIILAGRGSPLRLTDEGNKYFEISGCRAYFEKHLQEWLEDFEGLDKDYIVHDKAREFMDDYYKQSTDPEFQNIKAYMFNEGISHEQIMLMLSIGLRDMVCKEKGECKKQIEQVN